MAITRGKVLTVACLCALALQSPMAQTTKAPDPGDNLEDRLKMVVMLSRHGVRSPTWTPARLGVKIEAPVTARNGSVRQN